MSEESTGGIISAITDMAIKMFKKSTFVHEFYVHKNNLKICFGIKIKRLFSAIVTVKSQEKVTVITFNLNGYKYKLYLATGRILTAIRVSLLYIKGRVTKDAGLLRELNAVTLKKREYKEMKLNKKKIMRAIKAKAEINKKAKNKDDNGLDAGPLVIKFGRVGEDPKFDKIVTA